MNYFIERGFLKMSKINRILAVGFISFFFLTGLSSAAGAVKIGIVDFQKILEVSNAGKTAQVEINKQGKQMEDDLKNRGSEIEELEKKLERESLVMSKDVREEKLREVRIKIGDFKALQQKYMDDFKMLENRIINRIQKEVVELVQKYGEKEGFQLIVEKRTGGVVYAPANIDITDVVIQMYNVQVPPEAPEKKKK